MVNRTSIFASCLGLLICTITPAADATQVMTGYGAFRPHPNYAAQQCVTNLVGGALNQCSAVLGTAVFDLPITEMPGPTNFGITARSFGSSSTAFSCQAVAINPTNTTASFGVAQTFAAASGVDTKSFGVNVPVGWSLRLQCTNVPTNKGILSVRWVAVANS